MNPLNKKAIFSLGTIIGLLFLIAIYSGMFRDQIQPGTMPKKSGITGQTVLVQKTEHQRNESVAATVKAKQATVLSSRIMATIEKVYARSGDKITKGKILITLEDSDLQARSSQAKAEIQSVKAKLIEAELNLKRAIELNNKKLIAKSDLDKAQANVDALKANLTKAEQSLIETESQLAFATILAPIDGVIVDRFADPGDTVQPGINLLSIYNPSTLRIEANVREELAVHLEIGQILSVDIPSLSKQLKAVIEEIVPAANPGSRSFLIKSRLEETQDLLPGLYANLKIATESETLLKIPREYIIEVGQLNLVWVVSDNSLEKRFIKIGKSLNEGFVEVTSGLENGEVLSLPPTRI